jgi:hypothetical protein
MSAGNKIYKIQIGNSTESKVLELGNEGMTSEEAEAEFSLVMQYEQEEDPTLEFEKWWIEDDHGVVIEEHDVLVTVVPPAGS